MAPLRNASRLLGISATRTQPRKLSPSGAVNGSIFLLRTLPRATPRPATKCAEPSRAQAGEVREVTDCRRLRQPAAEILPPRREPSDLDLSTIRLIRSRQLSRPARSGPRIAARLYGVGRWHRAARRAN